MAWFAMTQTFDAALTQFERALAAEPLDYTTLLNAFRAIDIPAAPSAEDLTRLFTGCYKILDFDDTDFGARLKKELGDHPAGHLEACAGAEIEHVLYDANAGSRAWIAERIAWHESNDREVPEDYLDHDLPPALTIPWDNDTARQRIAPLLGYWQSVLPDVPTAHFSLAWKVLHDGYPVFKAIFSEWMQELDARGLGLPGTWAAFTKADELAALAEQDPPPEWAKCERDLLPLLHDPHPMIVAGAAKALGSFYAEDDFPGDPAAPDLETMLARLGGLNQFRAIASGAFVCGFDVDCSGLYSLQHDKRLADAGFDIDDWILHIVTGDDYEPYLPNAQALWFYIHEHYDHKPEMVMAFIDKGRSWLAMMCATEVHDHVSGMQPVLERLAKDDDPDIVRAAQEHLADHYRNGS